MDSTIRSLCAGLHSGSARIDCYLTFRSEEAAKAIADDQARKRKCQQIAQRIESGEEKDWQRVDPMSMKDPLAKLARELGGESPRYFYVGNDPAIHKKGNYLVFADRVRVPIYDNEISRHALIENPLLPLRSVRPPRMPPHCPAIG